MPCEVSCQLDQLEKAGYTIYPIKKIPVRAAKSRPAQNDPYMGIGYIRYWSNSTLLGDPYIGYLPLMLFGLVWFLAALRK